MSKKSEVCLILLIDPLRRLKYYRSIGLRLGKWKDHYSEIMDGSAATAVPLISGTAKFKIRSNGSVEA